MNVTRIETTVFLERSNERGEVWDETVHVTADVDLDGETVVLVESEPALDFFDDERELRQLRDAAWLRAERQARADSAARQLVDELLSVARAGTYERGEGTGPGVAADLGLAMAVLS